MNIRPFIIMGILVFTVLICAVGHLRISAEATPESQIIKKKNNIREPEPIPDEPPPVPLLIQQINESNAKIGSISCGKIDVKVWRSGMRFKLSGELYYEKRQRFRFKIASVFGEEIDIGSDDKCFWYWSRRDKDPGLHWANYKDFTKTRLKTPFNPMFMKKSLSLDVLNTEKARIVETKEDYILVYATKNGSGQPILASIFINKAKQRIDGMIVTDMGANPIASVEIQEYRDGIPSKILYIWQKEDQALLLELKNPKINVSIPASKWGMPDYKPKLNMAEDVNQIGAEGVSGS